MIYVKSKFHPLESLFWAISMKPVQSRAAP
jgi:hypothetical protein